MKNSTFLKHFIFLLMMCAAFSLGAQEGSTGKVFFLGIGVEKCSSGIPGKPNAVADVKAVAERTGKDVESGAITYYTQGENKELKQADGVIKKLLLNDAATSQAIDSMFTVFAGKATKDDIFYLYISASSNTEDGSFVVPSRSAAKKGAKSTGLESFKLDVARIQQLCSKIPCDKQVIIQDCEAWGSYHSELSQVFLDGAGSKKQLLITPFTASEDSFECNGKYLGQLATIIYKSETPILFAFSPFPSKAASVKEELTGATRTLGKKGTCYLFLPLWDVNAPPIKPPAGPVATGKSEETQKVAQTQKETKTEDKKQNSETKGTNRGFEADEHVADVQQLPPIRNYALIIANQNYEDPTVWGTLNNPVNDANAVKEELEKNYGFEVRLCVNLGIDSMLTEINDLQNKGFNQNSQVLFYYAGHGNAKKIPGGSVEGYVVPVDGDDPAKDKNLRSYITYNDIQFKLNNLGAQHVLAMYDACFSGSADPNVIVQEEEPVDNTQVASSRTRATVTVQIIDEMKKKSRIFIASGKFNPVSDGTKGKLSPFANIFLAELQEGRKNKQIVYSEDIASKLKQDPNSHSYSSTFGGEKSAAGSTFLFIPLSLITKK